MTRVMKMGQWGKTETLDPNKQIQPSDVIRIECNHIKTTATIHLKIIVKHIEDCTQCMNEHALKSIKTVLKKVSNDCIQGMRACTH